MGSFSSTSPGPWPGDSAEAQLPASAPALPASVHCCSGGQDSSEGAPMRHRLCLQVSRNLHPHPSFTLGPGIRNWRQIGTFSTPASWSPGGLLCPLDPMWGSCPWSTPFPGGLSFLQHQAAAVSLAALSTLSLQVHVSPGSGLGPPSLAQNHSQFRGWKLPPESTRGSDSQQGPGPSWHSPAGAPPSSCSAQLRTPLPPVSS